MNYLILLVDDDKTLTSYLRETLITEGYSVKVLNKGAEVLHTIEEIHPDIVLLDLGLPDVEGETISREIKDNFPETPVIILTGKDGVDDKVKAFKTGADDYITKPFATEELLARLSARLKLPSLEKVIKLADLCINLETVQVSRKNKIIELTPQEYKILVYLAQNKNKVLSREALLNKIWPNSFDIETRIVDVYISYLRKKVDGNNKQKLIQSKRGFGYYLKV